MFGNSKGEERMPTLSWRRMTSEAAFSYLELDLLELCLGVP
jgi:hypothetical protein